MGEISQALKEWAVVVEALLAGDLLLLLRKGGIREEKGRFAVKADRVLLFPTYEHQQADLVKAPYQQQVQPLALGAPPVVPLCGWAEITHSLPLERESQVLALDPFHIWSQRFVQERWTWKPSSPLYLLLLRSHHLPEPYSLPQRPEYGGCRSWISLTETVSTAGSTPVLAAAEYEARVKAVLKALEA
ncbi:MAG: DUF1802 family protein [Cyanobacteria bacterium Co-bin13]|nr:DUF1802 family protein [Cyanobacteria bacterium Co-bin13]